MKISKATREVLENFASITPSIKIFAGQWLGTITEERTIVARAATDETFPVDLFLDGAGPTKRFNMFCQTLKLFGDDADVNFGPHSMVISAGKFKQTLHYSDPATCKFQTLKGDPASRVFDAAFSFDLSASDYNVIDRASKIINVPHIVLESVAGGKITVSARNDAEKSSTDEHTFETEAVCADTFRIVFSKKNLQMIPGDYTISVEIKDDEPGKPPKFLARWTRNGTPSVFYYVAVEIGAQYKRS